MVESVGESSPAETDDGHYAHDDSNDDDRDNSIPFFLTLLTVINNNWLYASFIADSLIWRELEYATNDPSLSQVRQN